MKRLSQTSRPALLKQNATTILSKDNMIFKVLSIGDIHGRIEWIIPTFGSVSRFNDWLEKGDPSLIYPLNKYDKIIFVGDYTDSFTLSNLEILHNLKNIIA